MKTERPPHPDLAPRPGKTAPEFRGDGWWTIPEAAAYFDLPPKKLAGLIARNKWGDPLGNLQENRCYPFSVERYLRRNSSNETALKP